MPSQFATWLAEVPRRNCLSASYGASWEEPLSRKSTPTYSSTRLAHSNWEGACRCLPVQKSPEREAVPRLPPLGARSTSAAAILRPEAPAGSHAAASCSASDARSHTSCHVRGAWASRDWSGRSRAAERKATSCRASPASTEAVSGSACAASAWRTSELADAMSVPSLRPLRGLRITANGLPYPA